MPLQPLSDVLLKFCVAGPAPQSQREGALVLPRPPTNPPHMRRGTGVLLAQGLVGGSPCVCWAGLWLTGAVLDLEVHLHGGRGGVLAGFPILSAKKIGPPPDYLPTCWG